MGQGKKKKKACKNVQSLLGHSKGVCTTPEAVPLPRESSGRTLRPQPEWLWGAQLCPGPRLRCKFLEPLPQTDSESAGWGGACAPLSQDPKGHGSHLAHTKQSLPRGPSASPKMEQKLGKGTRFRKLPPQRHERKSESERSGFAGCINA